MELYRDMLLDIVDAWRMKDIRMVIRKIKKAVEHFDQLQADKKSTARKNNGKKGANNVTS